MRIHVICMFGHVLHANSVQVVEEASTTANCFHISTQVKIRLWQSIQTRTASDVLAHPLTYEPIMNCIWTI
jgi:hypothetical protein